MSHRKKRQRLSYRLAHRHQIGNGKSACRKSSIASDCVLGSRHRDVAAGDCQFGWLQGVRNLLRQTSFLLQRLDLNRRTPLPARLVQILQSPDELHVTIKIGNEKSASVELSRMLGSVRCIGTLLAVPKSACGKSQLGPLNCGPKGCRFERWLDIPTMRSHVARTMALPPRPNAGVRSNFGPIQEVGCTARFRVSDTRCGTCVILPAFLQSRCSPS
jgi:hypothetical protein